MSIITQRALYLLLIYAQISQFYTKSIKNIAKSPNIFTDTAEFIVTLYKDLDLFKYLSIYNMVL